MKDKKHKMTLYHYFRSSCSYRVRMALNFKKIPYDVIAVNLLKGEHKDPSFLKINPSGMVPALIDHSVSEIPFIQSLAILEYLDEKYQNSGLGQIFPTNLVDKAIVRSMCQIIVADTQPIQNIGVLNYLSSNLKISEGDKNKFAHDFIAKGLYSFEEMMKRHHGSFAFGGSFTAADICLVPQVFNANRFSVNMEEFPLISNLMKKLEKLDFVEKASPKHYE